MALDGTKPEWTLEDTLAVYTGSGYSWHHFKPREGAPLGCFFGFQEPRSIPGATFNMATVGALNPMFDSKYGVDALWQTVPNVQAYVADGLAPKVFPMVGRWKASDKSVLFKPMAAMLVVPVYAPAQTGLRSVEVNAAGYPISGLFGLTTYKTPARGLCRPGRAREWRRLLHQLPGVHLGAGRGRHCGGHLGIRCRRGALRGAAHRFLERFHGEGDRCRRQFNDAPDEPVGRTQASESRTVAAYGTDQVRAEGPRLPLRAPTPTFRRRSSSRARRSRPMSSTAGGWSAT